MSESSFVILFVSLYVLFSFIGVSSTEYVPVYMWETSQFSEIVPALERVSQESFRNILIERATNTPILVFAEQNLSPEDFTLRDVEGKTPFSQLSALKTSAQISYWPFVKSPCKVVRDLPDRTFVETDIASLLERDLTLHNDNVLLVNLNDAEEGEDRVQMLKRHDKDVMEIYNRFAKEHENLITLLSGYHSSWILSEELRSHRRARDAGSTVSTISEAPTAKNKTYQDSNILIYVNNVTTLSTNGTVVSLEDFTIKSTKTNTTAEVVFESTNRTDITVTLAFNMSSGYWTLVNISVHEDNLPEKEKDYSYIVRNIYAPQRFSYHCGSQTFYKLGNPNQNLTFPGFQMQLFTVENNTARFGDAYDCVGFMSTPIWSGIFVTFILALIMTFGLTMMMDIKTMDRFDDPKGKTITVSATE